MLTGGSGFLGRALRKTLEKQNYTVFSTSDLKIDLTDLKQYKKIPSREYIKIFHLATWTRAGTFCKIYPGEQWIINEKINLNMLSWYIDNCPQAHFITLGTSAGYSSSDEELKEEDYLKGDPSIDYYGYSTSKRSLLYGLISLRAQFGTTFSYYIPSTIYGPNYHLDGRENHFIFDLIKKILLGKRLGHSVTLWGDGYQERQLIYLQDVVEVLVSRCKKLDNEVINLHGHSSSIRNIARMICEIVGYDCSLISYDKNAFTGAKKKSLSSCKIDQYLKNIDRTTLQDGLKKTIRWMEGAIDADKNL